MKGTSGAERKEAGGTSPSDPLFEVVPSEEQNLVIQEAAYSRSLTFWTARKSISRARSRESPASDIGGETKSKKGMKEREREKEGQSEIETIVRHFVARRKK